MQFRSSDWFKIVMWLPSPSKKACKPKTHLSYKSYKTNRPKNWVILIMKAHVTIWIHRDPFWSQSESPPSSFLINHFCGQSKSWREYIEYMKGEEEGPNTKFCYVVKFYSKYNIVLTNVLIKNIRIVKASYKPKW